jgi:hypothetical protein
MVKQEMTSASNLSPELSGVAVGRIPKILDIAFSTFPDMHRK